MHLIMGLGNPGAQYEQTRHNAGFMVLDLLADDPAWEEKYDSLFLKTGQTILAKPRTYMNLSGKAAAKILKFYPEAELVVVHDELDLPLGSLRVGRNSSAAGHNGVQNIIDELGRQDFIRVRIGINNPGTRQDLPAEAYVLQKFQPEEQPVLKEALLKAAQAVETIQTSGLEAAQAKFNG